MDATTNHVLSYAGVRCRVLGTFYVAERGGDGEPVDYVLAFGSDLSNYYPNRGLKVYKPRGSVLQTIANYRDPATAHGLPARDPRPRRCRPLRVDEPSRSSASATSGSRSPPPTS